MMKTIDIKGFWLSMTNGLTAQQYVDRGLLIKHYAEGPNYYGNIGLSSAAWDEYGAGVDRTSATPDQQILIGEAIVGADTPDQDGCASW